MENEKLPYIFLNLKKQVTFCELQFNVVCRNVPTSSFELKRFVESPQLWQCVELFSNERGKLQKIYLKVHLEWN
jgi:hypothetical protein